MKRREFLKRCGVGAAVAIVAPAAVKAAKPERMTMTEATWDLTHPPRRYRDCDEIPVFEAYPVEYWSWDEVDGVVKINTYWKSAASALTGN